jgi:peptidoglycan hydrolase CwlO-like protein
MDNAFTTLKKSYYDNYLQYKISGDSSYQNAYQSAQQGIENLLAELSSKVSQQQSKIKSFYSDDVEDKLRETQSDIRNRQRQIVNENDKIEAANMRASVTSGGSVISPSYTWEYSVIAGLGVIALGLMALQQS